MKHFFHWLSSLSALYFGTAQAQNAAQRLSQSLRVPVRKLDTSTNAQPQIATFRQFIDHSNPDLGTFEQRYWWDIDSWNGPGSPIILFTPGETDATDYTSYCTNQTIVGLIAQEIGAATVVLEHRYWGESSPYTDLTTANLTYLTLENSIQDMVYFAQNPNFPFDTSSQRSTAADVPWVLVGGSYSGALAAWTASVAPGTFWAYLASSAVVEAISNFWEYFGPIQVGLPHNCTTNVAKVIEYMDGILTNGMLSTNAEVSKFLLIDLGSTSEVHALKRKFGLEQVKHNDDFMAVLLNAPLLWQTGIDIVPSQAWQWCDYVENSINTNSVPGPSGVSLKKALDGYAAWAKYFIPGSCSYYGYYPTGSLECYDTYNSSNPIFTDTTVGNPANRQWLWMLCNTPFAWWFDGAPEGKPSLVSTLLDAEYWTRQCGLYFPPGPQGQTYGIASGATVDRVNKYTGGWHTNTTRLMYSVGQLDGWRSASVSSEYRPGGPQASTPQTPIKIIEDGVHCYDLLTINGQNNAAVAAVQQADIRQIVKWVAEWT